MIMSNAKHIAVLKGGMSAEREVSLNSGAACARALRELGYEVTEIDVGRDLAKKLAEVKPDIVFNALHGRYGEDGCVQGLLEVMQVPYTHSGVLASAVAMDKPLAKIIMANAGLKVPAGKVVGADEILKGDPLPCPYVVKPANEGSSVGVYIIREGDEIPDLTEGDNWLVEEYIEGREITVAVLNGQALGTLEIRPKSGFYDYENKYTDGKTEHLCPAPLSDDETKIVMEMAVVAHNSLGCRGLTRSDFRYDGKDFYILEINTQPGMTSLSLSPEIAAYSGISFSNLVGRLVEEARYG
ncbi:MAG: D-alanine--D-alanine ligase [Rickettsiales bacterium]